MKNQIPTSGLTDISRTLQGAQLIPNHIDDTKSLCWNHRDSGFRIMNFNTIFVNLGAVLVGFLRFLETPY